jgi:hypothetical protein
MGRVLRNRSDGYFEEKNITAQQCAEADLAFGLESSLVLSSALNQVQWLVESSRPSRPSGLALCVGPLCQATETICQNKVVRSQ